MASIESNKARIAKRVIEVLEFFDDEHPQATVMDIVRRYDRPQSSTSELLQNLVGLGLLYKDRRSRAYSLTPRAAMLGNAVQPRPVRDGRLMALMDRLAAQTGLTVAIFGLVGLKVQICSWRAGHHVPHSASGELRSGRMELLTDSAVGWLLLSTVAQPGRDAMIRRLNAEATDDRKFNFSEMAARVQRCRETRGSAGIAGFGTIADTAAVLLPGLDDNQPLAIGFLFEPSNQIDVESLLRTLHEAVKSCTSEDDQASDNVQRLFNAA